MNALDGIIAMLFVTGIGFLTAVPIALPAACLWSLVLPGDYDHMPSVIAGFITWFVLFLIACVVFGKKVLR